MSGEEALDVDAERAAMFDHVWRRTRDTFYSKGYHGIDWVGLRPVYAKYLPYIGNNFEFAEMLAEMLGELNISHSGATFNQSQPQRRRHGVARPALRSDVHGRRREDRRGDQGRPARPARRRRSSRARSSSRSTATPIPPTKDIAEFLNRKAGKNVLLGRRRRRDEERRSS